MIQFVLKIFLRIFFGLYCIGFISGMFLHDKHPIFEKVWVYTGFIALGYGLTQMFIYAILGF